ncbi:hypothetical protein C2G38_2084411, partial [Gigaspora rosea]
MTDPLYEYSVSQLKEYEIRSLCASQRKGLSLMEMRKKRRVAKKKIRNMIICAKKI